MKLLFLVAGLLLATVTSAQAPSNDDCSGALAVPVVAAGSCSSAFNATTVGATASSQPGCVGSAEDDIWFKFTATQSAHVIQVSYDFVFIYEPVIELFSGTCGSLTSLKCSQRKVGSLAIRDIFTGLTPGVEYYARFYEKGNPSNRYPMRICVYEPTAGDECTNAVPVAINTDTSWTNYTQGSFQYTTASAPHCVPTYNNSGDLWYSFVANDSIQLIHHNVNNFNQGYRYQIYSGSCGSLTNVPVFISNDDTPIFCASPGNGGLEGALVVRNLTAGSTYYMRVMYDSTRYTSSTFSFALSNGPVNDVCANALDVPVNAGTECFQKLQANTKNATGFAMTTPCGTGVASDVWFKFTATAVKHIVSTKLPVFSFVNNINFSVFSGSCASLVGIYCATGSNDIRLAELTGLTPGATYLVKVSGGNRSDFHNKPFEVCITTPAVIPANEDCASAILLPNASTDYVLGAITDATASTTFTSCDNIRRDVWYKLVPPYNASITLRVVSGSTRIAKVSVLGGVCGAFTDVGCASIDGNKQALVSFNGVGGQTYYVRVTADVGGDPATGPLAVYISGLSALPVTMKDFRISKVTDKSIGLLWQTTDESKMRAYYIQRSSDGLTFTDIGSVPARNTASNEYTFTDNQPLPGRNYYRLRIVDVDDKVEYSKIIDAGLRSSGNFHIYTMGKTLRVLNDKNTSVQASLSIYDETGRNLLRRQVLLKPGVNTVNHLQLSKGTISFIHLNTPEGSQVFKIVW